MLSKLTHPATGLFIATGLIASGAVAAEKSVTIGHFGSALPFVAAMESGAFDKATGWKIDWRKFGSGTDVIAAMASGDVKVALLMIIAAIAFAFDLAMRGLEKRLVPWKSKA